MQRIRVTQTKQTTISKKWRKRGIPEIRVDRRQGLGKNFDDVRSVLSLFLESTYQNVESSESCCADLYLKLGQSTNYLISLG